MLICMQKISFITHFFLKILQIANCYFGWFGHAWPHTPKMMVSIWRNLWCLSKSKKSSSFFPFALRYCKDTTNLLFWVLWECLTISHKKSQHQSVGNFHAYLHAEKINFITHFFLKILQRNSKLVVLGNLGMPGHAHLKR